MTDGCYIHVPHAVSHSCEIQWGHQIQTLSVLTLMNLQQIYIAHAQHPPATNGSAGHQHYHALALNVAEQG